MAGLGQMDPRSRVLGELPRSPDEMTVALLILPAADQQNAKTVVGLSLPWLERYNPAQRVGRAPEIVQPLVHRAEEQPGIRQPAVPAHHAPAAHQGPTGLPLLEMALDLLDLPEQARPGSKRQKPVCLRAD